MTEAEEFEFRARLEKEQAAGAAGPKKVDTAAAVEHGLSQTAAEEENPNLVAVGRSFMKIPEAVGEMTGALSKTEMQGRAAAQRELGIEHPLTRPVETATDIAQGGVLPAVPAAEGAGALRRLLTSALPTGTIYGLLQPTSGQGSLPVEKAKQAAEGAGTAGVLSGAVDAIRRAPTWLRTGIESLFKPAAPIPTGKPAATAEAATGELQSQRDALEGKKGVPRGTSEAERAQEAFEGRIAPIKERAFNTGAKVDTADTVRVIDDFMAKNPDKQVQGALREVKATIDRAVKGASTTSLPAAGARMSPAQLKAMQGQAGKLDMKMADEVRQSINRLINQTGDKALSGHTRDVLTQVRDRMLKDAPKEYKDWISAEAQGRQEMEKFKPEVTAAGKVTTDQRGAAPLKGQDAQDALEKVFKGSTTTRDLKQLVDSTKHDPAAAEGLKEAFGKYLAPTNQAGKVNIKEAAKRWNDVKSAVKDSGIMSKTHFEATDKVMTELFKAEQGASGLKSAVAGTAALVGVPFGRPGTFAEGARTAVGFLTKSGDRTPAEIQKMVEKVISDERTARAAAGAPTPKNLEVLRRTLEITESGQKAKAEPPRRRVPNALGMRPSGL